MQRVREFQFMVDDGMTPLEAIRSAILVAADLLRKHQVLGSIAPGHFPI